ncbi:glycosyltransferase family 4 protein [Cobetia sp. cqz5-12]|uniref:glycosyltransferase family 4 protein n=1 Tax=Cobetia sp. cqz5-12 TaxID=2609415 RepID=UPI0019032038|nr:glycosyltransferase family 4 protein [Cobetia sp. cqz5-12]QQK64690.1 glycosyltransferase family 4 protein [Cobetia sp. cqz5-12]
MKILFVVGNLSSDGGTERVTCEIASGLARSGHDVMIASLFGPATSSFALEDSITTCCLNLKEARGGARRSLGISSALLTKVRHQQADVVVLVDSILFAFCAPWAPFQRARIICWEHFNLATDHGSRLRSVGRSTAVRLADAIVVLTERDAEAWRARYRIRDKVGAIWNPVPHFPKSSEEGAASRTVLAVGRLTKQKGFDVLLNAWHKVVSVHPDWRLRIVGWGEDENDLKAQAWTLGLSDSVVFVGRTSQVEKEYQRAALYVMSSRWEGLPMTLLEAQSFGLPVVSTDCETGPAEILAGGSGVLVDVEDDEALAREIRDLITDAARRREMSLLARDNATRFDADTLCGEWQQLLERLISGRTRIADAS